MALNKTAIKNLIFDLDDTLFDTMKQLILPASLEAYGAMIRMGLNGDINACLNEREFVFSTNPRVKFFEHLVRKFGVKDGVDAIEVTKVGMHAFHSRDLKESIEPFPDALPMLEEAKKTYNLYLITLGSPKTQTHKIKKLRFQKLFLQTFIVDIEHSTSKMDPLKEILGLWPKLPPEAFVSIGNRIDSEIHDAKVLGMQTILMNHGEYINLRPSNAFEIPDETITKLSQITELLR